MKSEETRKLSAKEQRRQDVFDETCEKLQSGTHNCAQAIVSTYTAPNTNKICYMILPEGIREDLDVGLKELACKYGVTIVVILGRFFVGPVCGVVGIQYKRFHQHHQYIRFALV